MRVPEHGYLRAAALGGVQQHVELAAAHGIAVAVCEKCLERPEGDELVGFLVVIVSVAVAGNAAHRYLRKHFAHLFGVIHPVAKVNDLVGLIFLNGVYHSAAKAVSVGKNCNFHDLPPVRIKL